MPQATSEEIISTVYNQHSKESSADDTNSNSRVPQLSFAGCGFLCIYHAGVGAAIKEYAPHLMRSRVKGSSAGAIAAAGLICDLCVSNATSTILQVVTEARVGSLQALSPNFDIIGLLRKGLEQSFPANAHILCNGRLFISATRARDYKNVIISEFDSREELIQAIICSCFIPFYCGLNAPYYRGEQYIDGGFSDNQPGKFESGTITVSPFSGESDICPSDDDSASMFGFDFYGTPIQFTTQNLFRMVVTLFPPSPEVCSRICRQGFEDTLRFLTKNCMAPCVKCLTVQSNAIPVRKEHEAVKSFRKSRLNNLRTNETNWMKSSSVASRMNNLRNECNRCSEPLDRFEPPRFSSVSLPNTLQKSFSEMEARNCTWMNYLRRHRIFRWWYRLLIPVILPCELLQFGVNKIRDWLSSVASTEQCFVRLQGFVDFFLAEIESRQLLHTPAPHFPSGVLPVGPISSFKIASSDVLPFAAVPSTAFPQSPLAESVGVPTRKVSSSVLMERRKSSVAPLDLAMSRALAEAREDEERTPAKDEAEDSLQLLGDLALTKSEIGFLPSLPPNNASSVSKALWTFFLAEIESRQLLHTPAPHFPSGVLPVGPISSFKIASSDVLPFAAVPSTAFPQSPLAESVGVPTRKVSSSVLMERRKSSVAPLDLAMSRALAEAREDEERTPAKDEAEDSLQLLGEYCSQHDAILAFHYMDDTTNQLKMCQIFDAQGRNRRKADECHPPISNTFFANDAVDEASPAAGLKESGEDDSGLSLTEEEEKLPLQSRRKASSSAIPTPFAMPFFPRRKDFSRRTIASGALPLFSSHNLASVTAKPLLSVPRRHTFSTQRPPLPSAISRIPSTPRKYSSASMNALKGGKSENDSARKTAEDGGGGAGRTNQTAVRRGGGIPQLIRRKTSARQPPVALDKNGLIGLFMARVVLHFRPVANPPHAVTGAGARTGPEALAKVDGWARYFSGNFREEA
uniref:PNPLA domain-containing protein n=1 Tax=Globodera pallida TaxID=36090 RepID=A0A183C2D8_GLOPA